MNMNRKKITFSSLLMIVLLSLGLCPYAVRIFSDGNRLVGEVNDVSQYAEIRTQNQVLMPHFPQTIPVEATEEELHYHPSFMQGGTVIQLGLQLPQDRIDRLADEYSQQAALILHGGNVVKGTIQGNDIPDPGIWLEDTGDFEGDYTTFFLHLEPHGEDEFLWNHGVTYGVMINDEKPIVIYWAEEW